MTIEELIKMIEGVENSIKAFQEKAEEEIRNTGSVAKETAGALDKLAEQQREIADRLLTIEQGGFNTGGITAPASMGQQFVDSDAYAAFVNGNTQKARFEVQNNTLTGSDATVAPDRKPGVVGGSFQPLALEDLFVSIPTSSNAIEYTRESVFTNAAAETAEAGNKPESTINFELKTMPVSTIAHWVRISRQLAADAPALAAYVNFRMSYGVNQRVETQLASGDGIAPNLSGFLTAGNFTAHGYAAADLGSTLAKMVLIRKLIGDAYSAGYPADAIVLNPADLATIETELLTTAAGQARVQYDQAGNMRLWGVPVVQAVGMPADQVAVGAFRMAGTIHNREGVMVELSESDGSNFTQNLVTVRAERRLALTVEKPAAIIAGDLTPA